MAYRAPNEDLTLTEAEQGDAVREFYGTGAWKDLSREQRTQATLSYLARHPTAHPDFKGQATRAPETRIDENAMRRIADAVAAETTRILCQVMGDFVRESCAEVESQFALTLADTLAATEATRKQSGVSVAVLERLDAFAKFMEATNEKLASFDRRISRHAEHLQKLENSRGR